MAYPLPTTSLSLLSRLRDDKDQIGWQVSWKRFVEIYHSPLLAIAASIYRTWTNNAIPSREFLEDVVSDVIVDFLTKDRFNPQRGRLRTYLRVLTNGKVINALRKERPFEKGPLSGEESHPEGVRPVPAETPGETRSFEEALCATLIEDLRGLIPMRHFEIFELVKLKGVPPESVARELGVHRRVVDNTVYKVMRRLRELAARPEYKDEFYP